jgi:hypothetical protein
MRPFWSALFLLVLPATLNAESPAHEPRICVATVGNASTVSVMVERLTDRLAKDLAKSKLDSIGMDSRTTSDEKLHPTLDNGEEARNKECDYILLTQVWDKRPLSSQGTAPAISIGGRVPSLDASDPLGGSSGPVYRENMQIKFSLFRTGKPDPILDTYLLERSSANVSDSFLAAMDREANRVSHELKKKKKQ